MIFLPHNTLEGSCGILKQKQNNFDVRETFGEGFETYSDNRIITYGMILRTEMKTVQKCTYNYINADVLGMKSYIMKIKWKEELQNKNIKLSTSKSNFSSL